jgi:branched-chain amino acid transport system permease protein
MSASSPPAARASAPAAPSTPRRLLGSSRNRALLIAVLIILGLIFLFGGDAWLVVIDITMIAAIATLGLNVLSGYAGQISLGISFFMAIGAYTAAWLGGNLPSQFDPTVGLGWSFFIWLPAAGIVAALVGALVGPTALRLKGFYLSIVTLALVFIGQYLFTNATKITGGPQGRSFPQPTIGDFSFQSPNPILGIQLTTNQCYFLLLLVILALVAIFVANLARSRVGRAFAAVRDNEVGAEIIGVNLFATKMGAFILSSFIAGIAGALYGSYFAYAEPNSWGLALSIQFVAALLIGGVASVWGSILGAAFVFALPQALETLSILPQSASAGGISGGNLSAIIYGLLIIVFLLFEPAGIIGLIRRIQMVMRRFDDRRKGGDTLQSTTSAEPPESSFDVDRTMLSRQSDAC